MDIDLNDPKVKEAIESAIAEKLSDATSKAEESIRKLTENNERLTKQLREARSKVSDIDPEKYAAMEDRVAQLTSELEKVQTDSKKTVEGLSKQLESITKQYESEANYTTKLLRDNGLTDVLMKAGVAPTFLKAVKAMLQDQVQIIADGDNRIAKVGDKALADFVTEWAQTDEGKVYIQAPVNTGSGAPGSTGTGGVKAIPVNDTKAFADNLADIATGKVKLVFPE